LGGIKRVAIEKIVQLKRASGCTIVITGGTEQGAHGQASGHYRGWKLDIRRNTCIDGYIQRTFTPSRGNKWIASSGTVYFREDPRHWDINYAGSR
jgi:hypothetical protein